MQPGLYDLDADTYHADPCLEPSLSASLAGVLHERTPIHAWTASRRLNPHWEPKEETRFDIGKAAHELLTGKGRGIKVLPFKDYRTDAAKVARDEARGEGWTVLTAEQAADVEAMVLCARIQLARLPGGDPFARGRNEMTMLWQQDGVSCRAMADCLDDDARVIWDYKTSEDADPEGWARRALGHHIDIRLAHYRNGADHVLGPGWGYRFVVQETKPPFGMSFVELHPAWEFMGEQKLIPVRRTWGECLRSGDWPGYPAEVAHIDLPAWAETRWMERQASEDDRTPYNPALLRAAFDWQAPMETTP